MRFVFASKYYYRRGGLEAYLLKARRLLEADGHGVIPFTTDYVENESHAYEEFAVRYNDLSTIKPLDFTNNAKAFASMLYNADAARKMTALCKRESPDIVQGFGVTKHLSASIFRAAKQCGVPTVMRLSDHALMCANSIGLDGAGDRCNGLECTSTLGTRCLRRRCVQGSLVASAVGLLEIKINGLMGFYKRHVDHWIAPSRFIKEKFVEFYGIDADRISHVPVFLDVGGAAPATRPTGGILYAGGLIAGKGIETLIRAVSESPELDLRIAGGGPLEQRLRRMAEGARGKIRFLGFLGFSRLQEEIRNSAMVVVPSECFENSPNIILESYAQARPVVGSLIGGIPEMVVGGETGELFPPGDHLALREAIERVADHAYAFGCAGKELLLSRYSPPAHLKALLGIYQRLGGGGLGVL